MVIELTGGVGAGKSRILELLEKEHGARILQTDRIAQALEEKGQEGYQRLLAHFGTRILGPEGDLDKAVMAELIFSDPEAAEAVGEAIHPMVWEQVKREAESARQEGLPLLVVETAIPYEKPDDIYDEVWYVYTLKETRIQRLMETRGYTRERALSIMERQPSEEAYEAMADRIFYNSGSPSDLCRQVREAVEDLSLLQK